MINSVILERLKNKASQIQTCYRISAIAFSKKGDKIGMVTNKVREDGRNPGRGSGIHAERRLIGKYGTRIKTIVIMRIGHGGDILPIHPCQVCQKVANKMGIKIVSVLET